MHFYKRWNNITGWAVFAVAAMVYLMTMEPVSSLWDCSEFIATSYKLEVGHPPGAPLFMMLARLATLFAFGNPDYVGIAVNAMNSLASAFCILFLFWTITHLARRLVTRDGAQLTAANTWAVLGAGAVGALAYTFTDTFWFSAVEGEVYALSSMFTALVVWLMLKWEEQADEPHSSRWIVLIAYLMGLSIGVHILNLLCIPALVFIYYFRKTATVTWRGIALSTLVSGAMIVFVNNIIIPYTVWIGAQIDTLFVNTFGLPVNSGITLFALALIVGGLYLLWRKVITINIPAAYILTVAVITFLFPMGGQSHLQWMLYQVLDGGLMLGAIFMATDYVTSPFTLKGKLVYGVCLGIVTFAIRYWGSYTEGVSFALLFMNLWVPYINDLTRQTPYGYIKPAKKAKEGAGK